MMPDPRELPRTKPAKWQRQVAEVDQHGQAMVEFAFTFVLLCGFFLALILFGWIFFSHITIVNAARDGSYHIWTHADGHPDDPDRFGELGIVAETTWLLTSTIPFLSPDNMVVNISPDREDWVPEGWVTVEILYTVPLPEVGIPLGLDGGTFALLGPMELRAVSRRSLN